MHNTSWKLVRSTAIGTLKNQPTPNPPRTHAIPNQIIHHLSFLFEWSGRGHVVAINLPFGTKECKLSGSGKRRSRHLSGPVGSLPFPAGRDAHRPQDRASDE